MNVEVYSIKNCVYCNLVKMFLKENNIPFKEFHMEIGGDVFLQEKKKWFKEIGLKTYPVTIIRDTNTILQGFEENQFKEVFLNEKDESNKSSQTH